MGSLPIMMTLLPDIILFNMNLYQTLTIIIAGLGLLGGIVAVYTKLMVEISKVKVEMLNFRHELDIERQASLKAESFNREDHKEILKKIDELIKMKCV